MLNKPLARNQAINLHAVAINWSNAIGLLMWVAKPAVRAVVTSAGRVNPLSAIAGVVLVAGSLRSSASKV